MKYVHTERNCKIFQFPFTHLKVFKKLITQFHYNLNFKIYLRFLLALPNSPSKRTKRVEACLLLSLVGADCVKLDDVPSVINQA